MGVDQTNESVIVGDAAVVKWATHLARGPHPAPRRIGVLRNGGFGGMPTPWGLVTWRQPDGAETLVASVDGYLPGAVDGWTWAVELITVAARDRHPAPFVAAAADVGKLVAELHAALSGTATMASGQDAARWRDAAVRHARNRLYPSRFRERHLRTGASRRARGHPGRPWRARGHTDHRGAWRPARGPGAAQPRPLRGDRLRWQPRASRCKSGCFRFRPPSTSRAWLSRWRTPRSSPAGTPHSTRQQWPHVDGAGRTAFLDAYCGRLTSLGHAELYDAGPLRALRTQQVLREIVYAARHLPRWMYVPDAALPALLDEGTPM